MTDAGNSKPIDFHAIHQRVLENRAKLDACPRHLFGTNVPGIEGGPAAMFGQKMTCRKCNGQMDLTHLNQYIRGYEAHGGNGNEILPGWKEEPGNGRSYFKPPEDA